MTYLAGAEADGSADEFLASQIRLRSPAVASDVDAVPLLTLLR